jgi:hypothetical protein
MKTEANQIMKQTILLSLLGAALMAPLAVGASETNHWTFDVSIYGLAAGMSGNMGIGYVNADVDAGFDKILDNLEFGAMGKVRVGYDRWAFNADVIYMGLGASKKGVEVEMDQWMVEPSVSYEICKYFEVLAGARYNNLSGEVLTPGILSTQRIRSGSQDWWDPIIGANLYFPLGKSFSLNLRGDIGGFGAGSDFTWQVYPYFGWRCAKWISLEAGYRWVYMDYETGSGTSRFKYDMLIQGPQLGFTFHF